MELTIVLPSARGQRREHGVAYLVERFAVRFANGFTRRKLAVLRRRIHVGAVLLQLVVQMRARGQPRRPDAPDELSLRDVHAGANAGAEPSSSRVVTSFIVTKLITGRPRKC